MFTRSRHGGFAIAFSGVLAFCALARPASAGVDEGLPAGISALSPADSARAIGGAPNRCWVTGNVCVMSPPAATCTPANGCKGLTYGAATGAANDIFCYEGSASQTCVQRTVPCITYPIFKCTITVQGLCNAGVPNGVGSRGFRGAATGSKC